MEAPGPGDRPSPYIRLGQRKFRKSWKQSMNSAGHGGLKGDAEGKLQASFIENRKWYLVTRLVTK
jgi:hypothetical protein